MPSAGQNFNQVALVALSPDDVAQRILSGTAGVPGYTVSMAGPGSIVLTRKYIPTWAIVVAVLGVLFFLIGLLALLYRDTEVTMVTITPVEGGSRVTASGVGNYEMLTRLTGTMSSMPALGGGAERAAH
ncbi:hypothetical protein [Mycolicibacter engbaekii]|uniref:hypothetical protein n=1 Tax=Mycolicibacter engbaekii TaxID=188915 RepID=UPI0010559485|nr:hypothetical protein [Mycolicibacter engbaekii]